jgi:hypothetical protein
VIPISTLHGEYRTEQQSTQQVNESNKMSSKNKGMGGRNRRKRARRNDIDLIHGKEFEKNEGQEYAKIIGVLGSGRFKGTRIKYYDDWFANLSNSTISRQQDSHLQGSRQDAAQRIRAQGTQWLNSAIEEFI